MNTEENQNSAPRSGRRGGFALLREHWRAWLAASIAYYGVLILGVVIVVFDRSIQQALLGTVGQTFGPTGPFSALFEAYTTAQIVRAVALTFVVNLFLGTLVYITLPSLIVPFSGILIGLIRALAWGFIFAPPVGTTLTAHSLLSGAAVVGLLILEGEAYVLGMVAAWIQGRAFLFHKRLGYGGLGQGYLAGLKQTALLYIPIAIVLIVAAIYEVTISTLLM